MIIRQQMKEIMIILMTRVVKIRTQVPQVKIKYSKKLFTQRLGKQLMFKWKLPNKENVDIMRSCKSN